MNSLLMLAGVLMLMLILRAIGLRNLSKDELAELEAVECPQCRVNLETIMSIYGLIKALQNFSSGGAKYIRRVLTARAKKSLKRVDSTSNKGAVSHT